MSDALRPSPISPTVDYDRDGVQHGMQQGVWRGLTAALALRACGASAACRQRPRASGRAY